MPIKDKEIDDIWKKTGENSYDKALALFQRYSGMDNEGSTTKAAFTRIFKQGQLGNKHGAEVAAALQRHQGTGHHFIVEQDEKSLAALIGRVQEKVPNPSVTGDLGNILNKIYHKIKNDPEQQEAKARIEQMIFSPSKKMENR